ncbi:MAG: hypothetical protein EA376_10390 [Phycisphaeraceae bacterium]|nr:MAG: hypothetical protein EA376_10390 [Phycisphaeraceae bacterium]
MPVYDVLLPHLLPMGVVLSRLAGIFIFAPVVGGLSIPARVKVLLAFGMTLLVYPTVDHSAIMPMELDLIMLAPMLLGEMLVGLSIGLLASIPILSVQMGGMLMGKQMGLALASVFNPALDLETDVIGQLLLYMGLIFFIMLGGVEFMFLAVAESFAAVPPGAMTLASSPLELLVGMIEAGYELAFRVAAPVLCLLMLEKLTSGFIMKTIPQINILSFGFPIKVMLGIVTLIASLTVIGEVTEVGVEEGILVALEWARTL